MKTVSVNLFPIKCGQEKDGVDEGPMILVESDLLEIIHGLNFKVERCLVSCTKETKNKSSIKNCSLACQKISKLVYEKATSNKFCLNLGGDHSIATGTIAGMLKAYPNLCVIWIDAHLDINTIETSPSGNVHGMAVSFLLDDHREKAKSCFPQEYSWCRENLLSPTRIAYIGIRQADLGELETINDLNITTFDMFSIKKSGIDHCIKTAIRKVDPENNRPIHISFDIDSIDPSFVSATGTPVKGGLTMLEILHIAEAIHDTGRMVGLDVVELNPLIQENEEEPMKTVENVLAAIRSFFGAKRPSLN